jgi:hypothetical protein
VTAATAQGKEFALEALNQRRKENKKRKRVDNSDLPVGAPMHFDCIGCGANISVSENYTSRPKLCPECQALKDLGWLQ